MKSVMLHERRKYGQLILLDGTAEPITGITYIGPNDPIPDGPYVVQPWVCPLGGYSYVYDFLYNTANQPLRYGTIPSTSYWANYGAGVSQKGYGAECVGGTTAYRQPPALKPSGVIDEYLDYSVNLYYGSVLPNGNSAYHIFSLSGAYTNDVTFNTFYDTLDTYGFGAGTMVLRVVYGLGGATLAAAVPIPNQTQLDGSFIGRCRLTRDIGTFELKVYFEKVLIATFTPPGGAGTFVGGMRLDVSGSGKRAGFGQYYAVFHTGVYDECRG